MKLNYKGKSAVVTGACGGMGLEISKMLSQNNINVLMLDVKKPEKDFLNKNKKCVFKKCVFKFNVDNTPENIEIVDRKNKTLFYFFTRKCSDCYWAGVLYNP